MQKFILKNNKRFQILNVLTDLVDVFRPKIFEPGNVRVRTRKKKSLTPPFCTEIKILEIAVSKCHFYQKIRNFPTHLLHMFSDPYDL